MTTPALRAHKAVASAIARGRLVRQPCETCGKEPEWWDNGRWQGHQTVVAHHEDYSRPLDVRWFCIRHHFARHRELNESRSA